MMQSHPVCTCSGDWLTIQQDITLSKELPALMSTSQKGLNLNFTLLRQASCCEQHLQSY